MEFKFVEYQDYSLMVQYVPSGLSVINLTMFHLILSHDVILDVQGDSEFMRFVNIVDYESRGDLLGGFPIMHNTPQSEEWIKFFSNGLENLADYIIVSEHILNILTVIKSTPYDLFRFITPLGMSSKSDPEEFLIEGFRTRNLSWLVKI